MLAAALSTGYINQASAAIIKIDSPVTMTDTRQPMLAIITDSDGYVYRQIVYFDPATSQIDLDLSTAGPNASIYIPALNVRYVLFNGYWVDESGYYWDGSQRTYVNNPNWNEYWTSYWHTHKADSGRQFRKDHRHWHDRDSNDWRGENREGRRFDRDSGRRFIDQRDGRFEGRVRNWQDRDFDNRQPGRAVHSTGYYSGQESSTYPSDGFEVQSGRTMRSDGQTGRMMPAGGFEGRPGSSMPSSSFESGQRSTSSAFEGRSGTSMPSGSFESGQGSTSSGAFEGRSGTSMPSSGFESGQRGASSGAFEGRSGTSMPSSGFESGQRSTSTGAFEGQSQSSMRSGSQSGSSMNGGRSR